mgnify:CR=1 FL=1
MKKRLGIEKPIEIQRAIDSDEPLKSITIHYAESWSHHAVLWQVIDKLSRKKFASKKEITEEWETILKSFQF